MATQPRQLHYSNNLSKNSIKKINVETTTKKKTEDNTMLRLTATQLKMSGKKWNQGTEMFGVNDKEPWHTYSTIFTGDMNEGHRRVQPTFMKEEQDISSRNKESPIAKNIASMYGGHKNQQWMRPYNKLYEREGGVWRRQVRNPLPSPSPPRPQATPQQPFSSRTN